MPSPKLTRSTEAWFWTLIRFLLGWILLWAFFDKTYGLNFSTSPSHAWLKGVSPTTGFLSHLNGPFAPLFHSLAGQAWVDWLFMLGLLLVGICLVLGIGLRIAGWAGALMMALFYLASYPPTTNPIVDEHIVYLVLFIAIGLGLARDSWGLGAWWRTLPFVKACSVLE